MGVHNLIPTMRGDPELAPVVCDDLPTYVPWHSEEEMEESLRKYPQFVTLARHITWDRSNRLLIHFGPTTLCLKIEDWMLALRQPKSRAKAEGYRHSGVNYYNDIIGPVIQYGRQSNVNCIILVVDKGSPAEKADTQQEREEARKKQEERKQSGKKRARDGEPLPLPDESRLPEGVDITDDGFVWTDPRNEEGKKVCCSPLDVSRLFSESNRPLRSRLYDYLRRCMSKDTRFHRSVNGETVHFGIIFDCDLRGPWRIRFDPESKTTVAEQMHQFRNSILEADLACFWWAARLGQTPTRSSDPRPVSQSRPTVARPSSHVFIHAGDTDYIPIALLNAHRFQQSLLIQIRAHDRLQDPVCIEALYARYHLHSLGISVSEFALGCALQGNDFVKKSWILSQVGVDLIRRGVRMYRRLRTEVYALFLQHEQSGHDRQLRRELLQILAGLPSDWSRFEAVAEKPETVNGEWVHACVFAEWPHGLDALVCCIYLLAFARSRAGQKRVVRCAKNVSSPSLPSHLNVADWNHYLTQFLRPLLDRCRDEMAEQRRRRQAPPTEEAKAKGTPRKPKQCLALPALNDAKYDKALRRTRFVLHYWATLQGTMVPKWE